VDRTNLDLLFVSGTLKVDKHMMCKNNANHFLMPKWQNNYVNVFHLDLDRGYLVNRNVWLIKFGIDLKGSKPN
jgi:hypothetical protein